MPSTAPKLAFAEPMEPRIFLSRLHPVAPPREITATALSSTAVRVDWSDNSPNEVAFLLFRSTDLSTWTRVAITPADTISYVDANLNPGTTYYYRVKSRSALSTSVTVVTATVTTLTSNQDAFAQLDSSNATLRIRGTNGDDVIGVRSANNNIQAILNGQTLSFSQEQVQRINIDALSGNDRVSVTTGAAALYVVGGQGNDTLIASIGNDGLDGGAGDDLIKGGEGDDTLLGGEGNDLIYGQAGNDSLRGGAGNDKLVAGDGDDWLFGDQDDDRLYGEGGFDLINAGTGNDVARQD
ncbi:MAG TPA: fibronectin type III domain-containing protein [Tepidisphaeraceae bacterium]|nr:fibronectin type III domain-containing protein [Tepidisphaeraceae bacterium]